DRRRCADWWRRAPAVTRRSHSGRQEETAVPYRPSPSAAWRSSPRPHTARGHLVADTTTAPEMKRSLTLTGITVNAMALIAPGAFLWTTFAAQSALANGGKSTAPDMWTGLVFAL